MTPERRQRLLNELNGMQQLADGSTIIFFESVGETPDFYSVRFKGRQITRESSVSAVEEVEEHTCDIRLPFSFPETPPDIRFTTSVFHPNIASGGFVDLASLGLKWTPDLSLAVVCERLWDACRMSIYQVERCANISAGAWIRDECRLRLPLDDRPLRDQADKSCSNVIRYKRRGSQPSELTATTSIREPDILFIGEDFIGEDVIGEDTPSPSPIPVDFVADSAVDSAPPAPPRPPMPYRPRRTTSPAEDVFYIGDEEAGER